MTTFGRKQTNKDTVILERRFVPQGAIVIKEGDLGRNAFVIQSGQVRVYVRGPGGKGRIELAVLGMGQIFGEMALVFDEPRSATVEAIEDCNLVIITRDTLQQKLDQSDPTVRAIVPMLLKRIIQANNVFINRQSDFGELIDAVNTIYSNIQRDLPPARRQTLDTLVFPKLQEFLLAARNFRDSGL